MKAKGVSQFVTCVNLDQHSNAHMIMLTPEFIVYITFTVL